MLDEVKVVCRMLIMFFCGFLIHAIGCTSAQRARTEAFGNDHRVTLYSGGEAVKTWTSDGKVMTETDSDGYYFRDKESKKLVRVSGDIVIEMLD